MTQRAGCCENRGVAFPILLISAGCLLLAEKFGLIELHEVWRYWPLALIALGLSMLFRRPEAKS